MMYKIMHIIVINQLRNKMREKNEEKQLIK